MHQQLLQRDGINLLTALNMSKEEAALCDKYIIRDISSTEVCFEDGSWIPHFDILSLMLPNMNKMLRGLQMVK